MRIFAEPGDCGGAGEFGVGFVENDDGMRGRGDDFFQRGRCDECAGGIVGIGEKKEARFFAQGDENAVERKLELRAVAELLAEKTGWKLKVSGQGLR